MLKKTLFLLIALTLVLPFVVFAEGQQEAAAEDGAVVLDVLDTWEPEFRKHYESWVAQFLEEYPNIKVKNSYVSWGDYLDKLKTLTAANRMPDVIYLHYSWAKNFIYKDTITNLEPYIAQAEQKGWDMDDFFAVALDGYRGPEGDLYSIPYDAGPLVLYYNMDLFKDSGIAPPPYKIENTGDWTLEQFLNVCKKLSKDTDGNGEFDQWGVDPSVLLDGSRYVWNLKTFGADLLNDDETELLIDTPEAKAATKWFAEMYTKHEVAPSPQMSQTAEDPFVYGKVGMAIGGSWMLKQWTTLGQFDSDIAHVPHKAGMDPVYVVAGSGYAIPAASEKKDAAWDYLRELLSKDGMAYVWGESGRGSPARESVWPTFLGAWTNKNAEVFPEALEYGEYVEPTGPQGPEVTDILNRLREELLMGDITVDEFVNTAIERFEQL